MAGLGDINPVHPLPPVRPNDRDDPRDPIVKTPPARKRQPDSREQGEDGQEQIDEYAVGETQHG